MFVQGGLAEETPFNIILEGKFVGRCFTTIAHDGLTKALFVTFGSDAISLDFKFAKIRGGFFFFFFVAFEGDVAFFFVCFLVGGFVGVCAAEGEGVVAVGFGWVVEGAVYIFFVW